MFGEAPYWPGDSVVADGLCLSRAFRALRQANRRIAATEKNGLIPKLGCTSQCSHLLPHARFAFPTLAMREVKSTIALLEIVA